MAVIRKRGVIGGDDDIPLSWDFTELTAITKVAVSNPVITQQRDEGNADLIITAPAVGGEGVASVVSASATCPASSVGGRWTLTCRVASGDHSKSTALQLIQSQ